MTCVVTYSAVPGRCPMKIGRVKCKAPVRVPAGCRQVSLRAPSDEQVHPWLPDGALLGPGRGPQGRPGRVLWRCNELCVLWHPHLLYLKLRCTFWDATVRGPHGQYPFQMAPGRQTPGGVHITGALEGPVRSAVRYTYGTLEHRKAPVNIFHENLPPKIVRGTSGHRPEPTRNRKVSYGPLRAFYGLTVR